MPIESPNRKRRSRTETAGYLVGAGIVLLGAAEVLIFLLWQHPASFWVLLRRFSAILAAIGLYGTAVGFMAGNKLFEPIHSTLADMLALHPLSYLAGNFRFVTLPLNFIAQASNPEYSANRGALAGLLALLLVFPAALLVFGYVLLHLLVIAPLSYLPNLAVSVLIDAVRSKSGDVVLAESATEPPAIPDDVVRLAGLNRPARISIKDLIGTSLYRTRGFAFGILPLLTSFFILLGFLVFGR